MKLKPIFAWYDLWVGFFWDAKKRRLYFFPVPMVGCCVEFPNEYPHRWFSLWLGLLRAHWWSVLRPNRWVRVDTLAENNGPRKVFGVSGYIWDEAVRDKRHARTFWHCGRNV